MNERRTNKMKNVLFVSLCIHLIICFTSLSYSVLGLSQTWGEWVITPIQYLIMTWFFLGTSINITIQLSDIGE